MADADRGQEHTLARLVATGSDLLLDASVGIFALWTVCYHVALELDWTRDQTATVWAALTGFGVVAVAVAAALRDPPRDRRNVPVRSTTPAAEAPAARPATPAWLVAVVTAVGLLTALYAATVTPTGAGWWPVWAGVVLVAGTGVVVTSRRSTASVSGDDDPRATPDRLDNPKVRAWGAVLVVVLAIGLAALSALTLRPEGDDVYVINRSLFVEVGDGTFPQRDTIFADEVFRDTRPDDVPSSSIEPLVGVVARALPVEAPTVAYLLLAPGVSALAVLALWRLMRTLRIRTAAFATAGAVAFLVLDGAENPSFGNFSFARAWQGKVVLVFLLVPLVWHYALAWSRDGDRRALAGLVAGGIAGVGLSSTGLLVVPAAAALGLVAGSITSGRFRRAAVGAGALVYPLVTWVVARAAERAPPVALHRAPAGSAAVPAPVAGPSAAASVPPPDLAQPAAGGLSGNLSDLDADTLWYYVFGDEVVALAVVVTAVALTWTTVRDRTARLALALASLSVVAVFYAPGAPEFIDDVTDSGSVLWRAVWIAPVPAMIGILLAAPLAFRTTRTRTAGMAASAAVVILLATTGTPVTDGDNVVDFGRFAWDVEPASRTAARQLDQLARPGEIAAAPIEIGRALSVTTIKVRPVNPRVHEMSGSHAVPEFRSLDRQLLSRALEEGLAPGQEDAFVEALDALRVGVACSAADLAGSAVERALQRAGFAAFARDGICTYWRRVLDPQVDGS